MVQQNKITQRSERKPSPVPLATSSKKSKIGKRFKWLRFADGDVKHWLESAQTKSSHLPSRRVPSSTKTHPFYNNVYALSDGNCRYSLRFWKADIVRLHKALKREEDYKLPSRVRVDGVEGICVMQHRLAYPGRYGGLAVMFGRSPTALCLIFRLMVNLMYAKYARLLALDLRAGYIRKESPIKRCIVFIDGTVRAIARPARDQRECYNGHKCKHALKFQGVLAPDGIFIDFYGPVVGRRRHDIYLLRESRILQRLQTAHSEAYCLFGDPAYSNTPNLQVGYKGSRLSRDQEAFNAAMSVVRVAVEYGFGGVTRLWPYVNIKVSSKLLLSPIGKYYLVAALLTNFRNCANPNQIRGVFGVKSPTLQVYIALLASTEAESSHNVNRRHALITL
ncbi:DDE superfamily endonuclease [Phytophthora infestans]|uniref:DDE superfamily endonuclease n=1 Tax=Phytophthora infestans TaxID=4787 RepID=A0A8S9V7G7_PHYIN|nr:DDE superfamily endonuclease [Phytophthora infestans]